MTNKKASSSNYDAALIFSCDLILTSDNELFVGIKYQLETFTDSPIVLFKYSTDCNFEFTKGVEKKGILCIEQKLLTRDLYEKVNEGDSIPVEYISCIARIYCEIVLAEKGNNSCKAYCKEILFTRNPRLHDIAYNSIISMLEMNYTQTGIEYGYYEDLGVFRIYLNKHKNSGKIYQIICTYNEFFRHSDYLKNFLKAPKVIKEKNFLCWELKYNQKYFENNIRLSYPDSLGV